MCGQTINEMIQLVSLPGSKKRVYVAKVRIPAGTIVSKSNGWLILNKSEGNELSDKVSFLENVLNNIRNVEENSILKDLSPREDELPGISEDKLTEANLVAAELLAANKKIKISQEVLARLYLVIKHNTFPIDVDYHLQSALQTGNATLCVELTFFNQSCHPNCIVHYSSTEGKFIVKTMDNIPAGSELTVSRVPILYPKHQRNGFLKGEFNWSDCECIRCKISEDSLGSYLNQLDKKMTAFDCPVGGCKGTLIKRDRSGVCDQCGHVLENCMEDFTKLLLQFNEFSVLAQTPKQGEKDLLDRIQYLKSEANRLKMNCFNAHLIQLQLIEAKMRKDRLTELRKKKDDGTLKEHLANYITVLKNILRMMNVMTPKNYPTRAFYTLDLGYALLALGDLAGVKYLEQAKNVLSISYGERLADECMKLETL